MMWRYIFYFTARPCLLNREIVFDILKYDMYMREIYYILITAEGSALLRIAWNRTVEYCPLPLLNDDDNNDYYNIVIAKNLLVVLLCQLLYVAIVFFISSESVN